MQAISEEDKKIIPILIQGLKNRAKSNPISVFDIVAAINSKHSLYGLKSTIAEHTVKELLNFIRINSLLPLLSNKDGYYVSNDKDEIYSFIKVLNENLDTITQSVNGLKYFL